MVTKFETKRVYDHIKENLSKVDWRHLFYHTLARPRALFILWLTFHNRLATKERVKRFILLEDDRCHFCPHIEIVEHLIFSCPHVNIIWKQVLNWMNMQHNPKGWNEEIRWLIHKGKGKGWKACLLPSAATETVYEVWRHKNNKSFGNSVNITNVWGIVIDTLTYKGWSNPKVTKHITCLMVD